METWDTAHYGDSCDCVRNWLPSVSVLYHAGYTPRLAPRWSENWRQQACLLPVLGHRIANVFHIHQRQLNVLYGLLRAPNLWAQGSGPVGATVGARLGPHTHGCWQRCFFWRGQTGWAARCTEEKSLDLSFLEIEKVLLKMLKKNEVISLLHGLKDVFGKITFGKKKTKRQEYWKLEWGACLTDKDTESRSWSKFNSSGTTFRNHILEEVRSQRDDAKQKEGCHARMSAVQMWGISRQTSFSGRYRWGMEILTHLPRRASHKSRVLSPSQAQAGRAVPSSPSKHCEFILLGGYRVLGARERQLCV